MKARSIRKICERCDRHFQIPYVRASLARELMLLYFPCPHCLYTQAPPGTLVDGIARRPGPKPPQPGAACRRCCIPFLFVKHHAKGFCKRCYRFVMGYL